MRVFKKTLSLLLVAVIILLVLSSCNSKNNSSSTANEVSTMNIITDSVWKEDDTYESFDDLSDPQLLKYMESAVYSDLLDNLDSEKYVVQNVQAIYISKEYLEESFYNSQSNIYFGYTLDELDNHFLGEKYVFTLDENGKTIVKQFEPYDDTYEKILTNVAIGTGVILVCVVIAVVTDGAGAPAAAAIFATSAKTGAIAALSSAVIGGTAAGVATGIKTQNFDESMKAAALAGSEGYKWGAITGAISGGASEAVGLYGATTNGLTMNQVALIQKESKYPLDVIKNFQNIEQYEVLKNAGISSKIVNGKAALVRNIDLKYTDENGLSNLVRMQRGLAPLDSNGNAYELHHIGQKVDSTLAILTQEEHRSAGNYLIWHSLNSPSEVHVAGYNWDTVRADFWKVFASIQMS